MLVAALLLTSLAFGQTTKNVLFVGNSYTNTNNLPQTVARVAASMGDEVTFSMNTPGGCTFQQHCTNESMQLIRQGGWDVVVLQEQSQYPSFTDGEVAAGVFPYAQRLVDSVYAHGWCTEPMFYMTWGRRDGDSYNAQFFPPLATYWGMDSLLYERYMQMGAMNDASVCPVGRVWRYLRSHHPDITLYQSDGSHPSTAGTYAAACAFYTMLFGRNPEEITFESGLTHEDALRIRQAARRVVYDSLPTWQRRQPALQVVEVDTPMYMDYSFDVESADCDTVLCSWGDGSDTLFVGGQHVSARHTYADTGRYMITVTATRHCINTVVTRTFHAVPEQLFVPFLSPLTSHRSPYPNPATDRVCVSREADLVLYTLDGREVSRRHAAAMPLDGLVPGVYLLAVDGQTYRIIKE